MKVFRRKSGTDKQSNIAECELLNEVQSCCSPRAQQGYVPTDASIHKAIAVLLDTNDKGDVDKALKFIAGELKSDSHRTVMLTLHTLGYLMKSDHLDFQRMLCTTKVVLKAMQSLIEYRKKSSSKQELLEQADFALMLIQAWAESLQGENDTKEIIDMYRDLKKKEWVRWPERNHAFDLISPSYARDGVSLDPDAPPPPVRKPASWRPSSLRTFSSKDTEWLRKDFDKFDNIIASLEAELAKTPDMDELKNNVLVTELVDECDRIGPQLRSMIEIVSVHMNSDPDALSPLLEMNDRLLKVIEKHTQIANTRPAPKPAAYNPFDDQDLLSQVFGQMPAPSQKQASSSHLLPDDLFATPLPPVAALPSPSVFSSMPMQSGYGAPTMSNAYPQRQAPSRPAPAPSRAAPMMVQQQPIYAQSNPFGGDDDLL